MNDSTTIRMYQSWRKRVIPNLFPSTGPIRGRTSTADLRAQGFEGIRYEVLFEKQNLIFGCASELLRGHQTAVSVTTKTLWCLQNALLCPDDRIHGLQPPRANAPGDVLPLASPICNTKVLANSCYSPSNLDSRNYFAPSEPLQTLDFFGVLHSFGVT